MVDRPFRGPRAMTADDVAAVVKLHAGVMANPWSRQNFHDSLVAGHTCSILEADGQILACLVARQLAPEIEILTIATRHDHQRLGLARYLLRGLLRDSAAQGMSSCSLEVRADNAAAIALYRRLGFSEVGRRQAYYPAAAGQRVAAIIMRKEYRKVDETD